MKLITTFQEKELNQNSYILARRNEHHFIFYCAFNFYQGGTYEINKLRPLIILCKYTIYTQFNLCQVSKFVTQSVKKSVVVSIPNMNKNKKTSTSLHFKTACSKKISQTLQNKFRNCEILF